MVTTGTLFPYELLDLINFYRYETLSCEIDYRRELQINYILSPNKFHLLMTPDKHRYATIGFYLNSKKGIVECLPIMSHWNHYQTLEDMQKYLKTHQILDFKVVTLSRP